MLLFTTHPDSPGPALLSFEPPPEGSAWQVYVNEELYDVVTDPSQRELWLDLDRTTDTRIELLAVAPDRMWEPRSAELIGWSPQPTTRTSLTILRDESLAPDSRVVAAVDGQEQPGAPLWRPRDPRSGFGGLFGQGSFGYDAAAAPGFGLGDFALGPFAFDAHAWRYVRDDLTPGTHTLDLRIEDARGLTIARLNAPRSIEIEAMPRPAKELVMDAGFTLGWHVDQ